MVKKKSTKKKNYELKKIEENESLVSKTVKGLDHLEEIEITPGSWNIVLVVVAALLIIGIMGGVASLVQSYRELEARSSVVVPLPSPTMTKEVPLDTLLANVENFIEGEMVMPGVDVEITDVETESNLYKLTIKLTYENESVNVSSYVTKDGKFLFYNWIEITEPKAPVPISVPTSSFDAPDAEKPEVAFFVMSFCPYGQQAEKGLEPVYQLLKDAVDWQPHYVIYENYRGGSSDYCIDNGNLCSMHGIDELMENVRQKCIWNNYDQDTWWAYIKYIYNNCNLGNINTCWLVAAQEAGVDSGVVESCVDENAVEYMREERDLNVNMSVSGSPTIFINGMEYYGGRAPADFQQGICSGFTEPPEACNVDLGATTSTATGSC